MEGEGGGTKHWLGGGGGAQLFTSAKSVCSIILSFFLSFFFTCEHSLQRGIRSSASCWVVRS